MEKCLITLGIESSCDETAVALLRGRNEPLSDQIASQHDLHQKYGGVVPELACRRHTEIIGSLVHEAFTQANLTLDDVGLVAVTRGPGLVGALLVGLSYAKGLAWGKKIPMVGVNHLTGHVAAAFLERPDMPLPALALLVSGGHTELYLVTRPGQMKRLGATRDDAAGEAFDKAARMLGLAYPGGPEIQKMAAQGQARFTIPVAMRNSAKPDFSFSGPKTAVKRLIGELTADGKELPVADICASFQVAVVTALYEKTKLAATQNNVASLAVVGGVACNSALRQRIKKLGNELQLPVVIPPPSLCSDNGIMIAAAGAAAYLDNPDNRWWHDYLALDADSSLDPAI